MNDKERETMEAWRREKEEKLVKSTAVRMNLSRQTGAVDAILRLSRERGPSPKGEYALTRDELKLLQETATEMEETTFELMREVTD